MAQINFGILDTSMPGKIAGSIQEGRRNALATQSAQQQQQLNAMQLDSAKRDAEAEVATRNALAGGDINAAAENLMKQGYYKQAQALQTQIQNQRKAKMEEGIATLGLVRQGADDIFQDPTSETVEKVLGGLEKRFGVDVSADRDEFARAGGDQAKIREIARRHAFTAEQTASKIKYEDTGPVLAPIESNSLAPGYNPQPIQKGVSPEAALTDSRTRELAASTDARLRELAASRQGGNAMPHLAEAMSSGWFPSRRMSTVEMQMMETALATRKADGQPITADFLREIEFQSKKNAATGTAAGSRPVVARKQNIEAAFPLLDDIEKSATKLNYSDNRYYAELEKWKNGVSNDPTFVEYMTQRADALFVLGNALKQNGLTDKAIEVEEEAARPTMSPRAVKAWLNVQRRALNRAAEEMNKDYDYEIPTTPTAEPGLGGVVPKPGVDSTGKTNAKGWALHTDANGNKAYVSPDGKQFEEVK